MLVIFFDEMYYEKISPINIIAQIDTEYKYLIAYLLQTINA